MERAVPKRPACSHPRSTYSVDGVNEATQGHHRTSEIPSPLPLVNAPTRKFGIPTRTFDSRHLYEIAWDPCFSAYVT